MKSQVNIYDIIKDYYTTDDFRIMFQRSLYKNYNIVLPVEDDFSKYDATKVYKKDDIVYTKRLGTYTTYFSLLDNNQEPLNNTNAWECTEDIIIDDTELQAMISMAMDLVPYSLYDLYVPADDTASINKLKYILGLFIACYLGNKNGVFGDGDGCKYVVSQSIDGLHASYKVPDYLLSQDNLFYSGNPYGLELLSLYKKLFVSKVLDIGRHMLVVPNFYIDYYNLHLIGKN